MPVGVTKGSQKRPNITDKRVTIQPPTANYSDSEFGHMADALHSGVRRSLPETSGQDSDGSVDESPVNPRPPS